MDNAEIASDAESSSCDDISALPEQSNNAQVVVAEVVKFGHGGARPGGGKPKGMRWPSSIRKEKARALVARLVEKELRELVQAQVANAKGIKYMVVRNKRSGKFVRVTEAMARSLGERGAEDSEDEIIEIWEKDPSVQAFTDLLNRAIDKPAEQVRVTGEEGGPVEHVFRWQD